MRLGIAKLDEYLNGLPSGKSLLFYIEPGIEESNIALHVLRYNLEKGLHGIYISSESPPKNIEKKFREFNWNIKDYSNLIIVDGYSSLIGAPTEEKYVVEEPHDIRSYEDVILQLLDEIGNETIIVFDSLSNIMDLCGERSALEGIERINVEIEKKSANSIFNFIAWPYKEGILYRIKRLFNAIIEVRSVENANWQKFIIKKSDWGAGVGKSIYFKIFKPDGLRVYIPKISVIGPVNAGKTTFIKAMAREFYPVERLGTTAGMEYGVVDYKGYRAEIFGIPGKKQFLPLLELAKSSYGIFLVVDSTKKEEFEYAKEMINKFKGIPYIVVANKQDMEGACDEKEIKEIMGEDVDVVKTVAIRGEGVFEAFEMLVEKIMESSNAG